MTTNGMPLVSVVMPVYNGAEFLTAAIQSVQSQTYTNWNLTVGNNRSTDRTAQVAQALAAEDPRIRVVTYDEHVGVVESHNIAVTLIAADAKYCKILGADDLLFPTCLQDLVATAEMYPSIGMVTSYVLSGSRVEFSGLPFPSPFTSGRDICRLRFLENIRIFGGPSSSLIRADIVRSQRPFYAPGNYHGDNEAYLELLKHSDFGFVHRVLSYNRRGEASRTTSYLDRVDSHTAGYLLELTRFGPAYLSPQESRQQRRVLSREYYRWLARCVFELRGREFWHYHATHMKGLGQPLQYCRLAAWVASGVADYIFNPLRLLKAVVRRLSQLIVRMIKTVRSARVSRREVRGSISI